MTLFAVILFVLSLIGIAALFGVKQWEISKEQQLAPSLRVKVDLRALKLKELLTYSKSNMERIPPLVARFTRILVHKGALGFARGARAAERQAYHLADMVSHKHRFERRVTQSEFLKKVSEAKTSVEEVVGLE